MRRPAIAVSVGCPSGTGPELSVLAAATVDASSILVGDIDVLRRAASIRQIEPNRLYLVESSVDVRTLEQGKIGVWAASKRLSRLSAFGAPEAEDGAAQLAWIEEAMSMTRQGIVDALVRATDWMADRANW